MHMRIVLIMAAIIVFTSQIASYADKSSSTLATSHEIHGPKKEFIETALISKLKAELQELKTKKLAIWDMFWKIHRGIESVPRINFGMAKLTFFDNERKEAAERLLAENLKNIDLQIQAIEARLKRNKAE